MLLGILYWRNRAGPVGIFSVLESWLVRPWVMCVCILCFWRFVSCLTWFFFGAFISIPDLLDMLRCGCTFFIPVSNGCFCTLICKRYAVMEESLIKRIALSIEEKTWQQKMITCDREYIFFCLWTIFVFLVISNILLLLGLPYIIMFQIEIRKKYAIDIARFFCCTTWNIAYCLYRDKF